MMGRYAGHVRVTAGQSLSDEQWHAMVDAYRQQCPDLSTVVLSRLIDFSWFVWGEA